MKLIDVMICVNDPASGNYVARCAGMEFGDRYKTAFHLSLEPTVFPEPRCTIKSGPKTFSIHRCQIEFIRYKEWVGNWCWDMFTVTPENAAQLIKACLNSGAWRIDECTGDAAIGLWDRMTQKQYVPSAADWLKAISPETK